MAEYIYLFKPAFHLALLTILSLSPALAEEQRDVVPVISIIIDDIGYRIHEDPQAIAIPGSLAYAIMPHSPHAHKMSRLANKNGKLVLLHLPMESITKEKNRFLGPGALTLDMTRDEFMRTLNIDLQSLPEAVGVNNHMGSLLTRHPGHMEWLMESLRKNKKFYIDSNTIGHSIAGNIAGENRVPYLRRDVFLDNERNKSYIKSQLSELIRIAKIKGKAIAIGHPHPETISVLNSEVRELEKCGVMLVELTELLNSSLIIP